MELIESSILHYLNKVSLALQMDWQLQDIQLLLKYNLEITSFPLLIKLSAMLLSIDTDLEDSMIVAH